MDSLEQLIATIAKEAGKTQDEVKVLVDEKKVELSGLVSEEGAAYIVGRELGVSLLKEGKRSLKVKNLVDGMRGVDLTVRVVRIFDVKEFERQGKKGKLLPLLLGDETGVIRMPLWNQEADAVLQMELKEDDVIAIQNGWVKIDNRGNLELRLGKGKLTKSDDTIDIPAKEELATFSSAKRTPLAKAQEGQSIEVRGCLVQLYRKDPFFETCPDCGTRVFEEDGKPRCKEHGIVTPQTQMVVSGVLDDGTGNVRVVFFRELAEKLLGEKVDGLKQIASRANDPLDMFDVFTSLGKDFIIKGRVKKNDFTGNLELVASDIQDVDVKKEAELLLEQSNV